ncbi:MAG: YceD family protein [bacterium]|nr:YceD family protein [bacterium]
MKADLEISLVRIPDDGLDLDLVVEAADLGIEGEDWPPATDIRIRGRLEKTGEEAVFRGRVSGKLLLVCSLGLAELPFPVDEPLMIYFQPLPAHRPVEEEEVELEERSLDISFIKGGRVELAPPVRDIIGLAIPIQPRCPGKCLGEAPEMCRHLLEGEGVGDKEHIDPRWASLREWKR